MTPAQEQNAITEEKLPADAEDVLSINVLNALCVRGVDSSF